MKSMKINKDKLIDVTFAEKSSDFNSPANPAGPEYFYGLRLCLNNDAIRALGLKKLPEVGEKLKLSAMVEVCCKSESESQEYGLSQNMDLQITEMDLGVLKKDDQSEKLYGENNVKVVKD